MAEKQEEIDRLNVFPVPDGDTGRNMYLTMLAAVQELERTDSQKPGVICGALARGSMMGARGNSGVIMSQLIRGFADAVRDEDEITAKHFARAWQAAVATAYHAVMKPVEGTMLTVAKGVSEGLVEAARNGDDLEKALFIALQKGNETLKETPEMLPVLKKAGVVDAGGKGLMVWLEGGLKALGNGERPPGSGATEAVFTPVDPALEPGSGLRSPAQDAADEFVYAYCVEFLLQSGQFAAEKLGKSLRRHGGSLIVACDGELIRVHVHSNHPGEVLEHCLRYGPIHQIRISNMKDQWQQKHGMPIQPGTRPAAATAEANNLPGGRSEAEDSLHEARLTHAATGSLPEIGVLAVAAGTGIKEIFRNLGAAEIVEGGQTMNPPVAEFVRAIEDMPQAQVLILPNNKNLILAAEQAKGLVGRKVEVLPTTSIQAGIAALLSFNPDQGLAANMERMEQAANRIKSAEVTYAVREALVKGTVIKAGSLIGLWQDEIAVAGTSLEQVVLSLVDQMLGDQDELVTLFVGTGVAGEEAEAIAAAIRGGHQGITVEVQPGHQPVYYFLISVE